MATPYLMGPVLHLVIETAVDHEKRARSTDNRMDSAWFGQGAVLKDKALTSALGLVS